ncbi:MAG TPA: tRNA (adenosine(37)-N6)-threonylcarbamoyltransferase complex ATPase subunit type 1 TsaE [Candidatus Omnitrophota bacterium]|nr:tRNA (adenosine(37)-N6)-threonylcarbamoyltransferase complex ATPase subunit type 1 TsaE [Candidatus Omnitrophota bacterium]HPT07342.1 tRNA (adenosine(37)-N6)-threonylcarbamoyltransferase complex ATPase subunit type 1 TsaE [Candidatus Omnitrophota bacterium]
MHIISKSACDTLKFGKSMARSLGPGDIVCLVGQLGAGKSVLARGIVKGLGVRQERVTSPTFVLVNQYAGTHFPVNHFDLYRLLDSNDIAHLGYEEYFYGEGVSVIEWADRLGKLMPSDYVKVHIAIQSENTRSIIISASGKRSRAVVEHIHENYCH